MLTIPNLPTADTFTDSLTLGPVQGAKLIKYVVANASVFARIWPQSKSGTIPAPSDELLITPETNIVTDAMGIEFRSAVAGTPAQVIAQLLEEGDPMIGGGTPFTATISSTGAVTPGGGVGADGWASIGTILTFASADGHTFVVGTNADLTATVPVGARVKFTQDGTTKYFIVTAITAAQLTLYGGTDYTVTGTAITAVSYSVAKVPLGFNADPEKWMEQVRDTGIRSQSSPVNNQWYNLGGLSLAVPIGAWILSYQVGEQTSTSAQTSSDAWATLSQANSTESDQDFTAWHYQGGSGAVVTGLVAYFLRDKYIVLAAKTTYYLLGRWSNGGAALGINTRGDTNPTIIRAVCAYL